MKGSLAEDVKTIDIKHKISGVRIGTIVEITDGGQVLVDFPGNLFGPIPARFAEAIGSKLRKILSSGDDHVLLVFEDDDPKRPIIIDTVRSSIDDIPGQDPVAFQMNDAEDVFIDGRRISFDAKEQVVLRCGKSSITLTKAGKVIIRGAYLLSRSSGVNSIKGGSIQLN